MAEHATPAEKSTAKAPELKQWTEEDGNLVFHSEVPDLDRIKKDRERISNELRDSDKYDSNGLGDTASGDASTKASDHILSSDPAKRAFPPGPDDPSKL